MGGGQSTEQEQERSPVEQLYGRLYKEMKKTSNSDQTSSSADSTSDVDVFKSRFVDYFGGGPCVKFGQLLYSRLFGENKMDSTDEEAEETMFIAALSQLRKASTHIGEDHHDTARYYFLVFTQGEDHINREGLMETIYSAVMFALVVGSEFHENTVIQRDHPIIQSIVSSAMLVTNQSSSELSVTQFAVWMKEHCPRLLDGMLHWVLSLLRSSYHQHQDHDHHAAAANSMFGAQYQLPSPKIEEEMEKQLSEIYVLIWAMSTIVPPVYMGQTAKKGATPAHPMGGTWTSLYSSDRDGFSMNRLQNHCFDYREPSIMVVSCQDKEGKEYCYAIGTDREWRDGPYFWGGDDFFCLELQPSFKMINSGPKLISLNEKTRGFPTGLRVMANTQYKHCVFKLESSLDTALLNDSIPLSVIKIELWGCGGQEAAEYQRRIREWEKKEILRRQKISRAELISTWEDSPDRYLLELGGVKTNRPREQQQQ